MEKTDRLTVRVPKGWIDTLRTIGQPEAQDVSAVVRVALIRCHPELKKVKVDMPGFEGTNERLNSL